ncbi:AAA family ATPase [Candidatus Collierbacteria bacterium]|nr:AAA family ATPase [Candidatus Collierbacteria bacterium]
MPEIEINPKFKEALQLLEHSSQNLFITGRAGTGKSTLLEYFRGQTSKSLAVLAPTGVAAINVRGQTIHSFFGFKPDITIEKAKAVHVRAEKRELYKKLDVLIIDEISMVRADLLDCVDAFLRQNGKQRQKPFGGIRVVFLGDLYQLPPVVSRDETELFQSQYQSPYFFDARSMEGFPLTIVELTTIYRQSDPDFIALLNAVRSGIIDENQLLKLNSRHDPFFVPPVNQFYLRLTTTNAKAEMINQQEIEQSLGEVSVFDGITTGQFDNRALPAPAGLQLKVGAQVMLVSNDRARRWVNGTMGKIEKISESAGFNKIIFVRLDSGEIVEVTPFTWEMFRFVLREDNGKVDSQSVGSYTQYPLILAWAVTIHKAQGKTFDRVIVDFDRGTFAHGQAYVALSRVTSLSGLVLTQPLQSRHLILDRRVVDFLNNFGERRIVEDLTFDL